MQKAVPESEMWRPRRAKTVALADGEATLRQPAPIVETVFIRIFQPPFAKHTFALLFVNFFGMFAWWGLFTWIPPYLSLPVSQGGRGFGVMGTTTLLIVLNLAGMFPGYASFGWVADRLGRRNSFIVYTFMASLLVPLYAIARHPAALLVL